MRNRIALTVISAAALAACQPRPGPLSAAASAPTATAAGTATTPLVPRCLLPGVGAARCKREGGKRVCRLLAIEAPGHGVLVVPYILKVGQPGASREVTIIWELVGPDEEFVAKNGDGPIQLPNTNGFTNGWISDSPDGAASASRGQYYRIEFANEETVVNGISYDLQFTGSGERTLRCDPTINNDTG